MSIMDRPERDRPQDKVLANGRAALPDDNLLATFLRIGVTGRAMAGGDVTDRCQ
jgi:DNA repair protein RadC